MGRLFCTTLYVFCAAAKFGGLCKVQIFCYVFTSVFHEIFLQWYCIYYWVISLFQLVFSLSRNTTYTHRLQGVNYRRRRFIIYYYYTSGQRSDAV